MKRYLFLITPLLCSATLKASPQKHAQSTTQYQFTVTQIAIDAYKKRFGESLFEDFNEEDNTSNTIKTQKNKRVSNPHL